MRKKIFEIIEVDDKKNSISHIYDMVMMIAIIISLIPLALKSPPTFFTWVERIITGLFIIDYILRLITADLKLGRGKISFLIYPLTFMSIIDILSILPTILLMSEAFRVLKAIRFLRAMRVLKIFKGFRYSKNITIIINVFKEQKRSLITVGILAVGYIFISALAVFNVEPETFPTFFDAIYWSTVSLTTVGYGDIYTVSVVGRLITMISSVLGVAIVALPAGIITAGYMKALEAESSNGKCNTVTVVIDRPIGTRHPKFDTVYPINYGYIEGLMGGDGEWQDAYVLGVDKPVKTFTGKLIAVIHRSDDNEDKYVVAPQDCDFSDEEIIRQTHFMEKHFKSSIKRKW